MPIGTLTMILANVGLQVYNNWCGNRQNSELQQKREEFELAARDRNTEHMWKLLREGQSLTMQMEAERHNDRIQGLKDEVDNLLQKLAYEEAIRNWPLKVLPIVMKNQAIGNLLSRQTENEDVAMHVIFTRSNYDKFNRIVYPIVEKQLEQYCDKHWTTMSDHPVLFYSGAWKSQCNPTGVEISSMRTALCNLPTLLITPFFRPGDGKLVFQVNMWGVGAATTDQFNIPEIEPLDFQRQFSNQDDYENEIGLLDEMVEDMVPYLQCLIGYMADTYFWSSSGLAPHLPLLVTNGTINTDGMKYLVRDSGEYYDQLLLSSEENAKKNPFVQENLMNLYEGSSFLWDEIIKKERLEEIFFTFCSKKTGLEVFTMKDALNSLPMIKCQTSKEVDFLSKISNVIDDEVSKYTVNTIIKEYSDKALCIDVCFTASQRELQEKIKELNVNSCKYFLFKVITQNIIVGLYSDSIDNSSTQKYYVFLCNDTMGVNSGIFVSAINNFRATSIASDAFSKVQINNTAISNLFKQKKDDFEKFIRLYDELDTKTDIDSLCNQENLFLTKKDILNWIRVNAKTTYSDFSLFKGFSAKHKKYLLFGTFKTNGKIHLGEKILVSFYNSIPSEIDILFLNNIQYSLKIK